MKFKSDLTSAQSDADYAREDAKRLAAMPEHLRRVCWCQACGLVFTGVAGFDAHRTGPWEARRCLTTDELREKGYEPNEHGRWGRVGHD